MRDAPWKSLVEQLKEPDPKNEYVARLAARVGAAAPGRNLERELVEEMAYALRRSTEKLEHALRDLTLAETRIASAEGPERAECIAAYDRQRERALRARWELSIHREALGFRRPREVESTYPIPPRRGT
jgi:hypothetical protein